MKYHLLFLVSLLVIANGLRGAANSPTEQAWSDLRKEIIQLGKKQSPENSYRFNQAVEVIDASIKQKRYSELEPYLGFLAQQAGETPDAYKQTLATFTSAIMAAKQAESAAREAQIDQYATEFKAKFKAGAPAKEYDGLIRNINGLVGEITLQQRGGRDFQVPAMKATALQRFVTLWQDYQIARATSDGEKAQQALRGLSESNYAGSIEIMPRSELQAILGEMQKTVSTANEARQQTLGTQVDQFMSRVPDLLDAAKHASDLDQAITDLLRLERELNQPPYDQKRSQANAGRISAAKRLLMRWQDRLVALANGNRNGADQIIQELANSNIEVTAIYPRSKILQAPAPSSAPAKSNPVSQSSTGEEFIPDSLAGVEAAHMAFVAREESHQEPIGHSSAETEFNVIYQAYTQLRMGDPTAALRLDPRLANYGYGSPPQISAKLATLRTALLVEAIPVYFNLPADFKPTSKDQPAKVLAEAAVYAQGKSDWYLLLRIVEYWSQNFSATPSEGITLKDESYALRTYFAATNQEKAGQYTMAAVSYRRALGVPSHYVPLEDIGRRLESLKKDHPKEFGEASAIEAQLPPASPQELPPR